MLVKLSDLWNARATLGKLATMSFKAKTSYKLMKLIDQANKELEPFGKVRQEVFLKYGDQDGEKIVVRQDEIEAFTKEMEELDHQEVDLKFTVTLDELSNADLTPSELFDLNFMFVEEIAVPQ